MILPAALVLSWILVGTQIAVMRALGLGKTVRVDGPAAHLEKSGTTSMGGLAFTLAAVLVYALSPHLGENMPAVLLVALGYGLLGLADDLADQLGHPLRAREKLVLQVMMALVFAVFTVRTVQYTPYAWLDVLLVSFAVVGAANAFNFTDGLDGLATGVSGVLLLPFLGLGLAQAFLGALLGFLWYNAPKARIFMGDAGSQLLGALIAALFISQGKMWFLPLAALVPVLEIVSVIVQVGYFQRTGKRILKMAPLHHHFELSGWNESKIVFRFIVFTALCTALAMHLWGGL